MGEIANDIINGFQCSWCGICFVDEHGYPVLCTSCWKDAKEDGTDPVKEHGISKHSHKEI